MLSKLNFTINAIPVAQPRARVTRWGTFDPAKDRKTWTKCLIKEQLGLQEKLQCPIFLDLVFRMPIPKSSSKKIKQDIINEKMKHVKKPDIDNMIIFIMNAMSDLVYYDDRQIYRISAEKKYSEKPGVDITVLWDSDCNINSNNLI